MAISLLTLWRMDHEVCVKGGTHERLVGYFGRIEEIRGSMGNSI